MDWWWAYLLAAVWLAVCTSAVIREDKPVPMPPPRSLDVYQPLPPLPRSWVRPTVLVDSASLYLASLAPTIHNVLFTASKIVGPGTLRLVHGRMGSPFFAPGLPSDDGPTVVAVDCEFHNCYFVDVRLET